ncbi:MAG TPA: CehA/McbA family metallohydrolase [Planctomycetota bacterium]|nr:CehA/McbA family metallohydrolase [Planctomycetota bacterium]
MPVKLTNPYALKGASKGQWMRGNLHTHTTRSDGSREPQAVVDDYRKRGYDFLMISDHDKITDPQEVRPGTMLLIRGNEISARGPHMLHVDARAWVEPTADRQAAINRSLKTGSFVVLNHPNWESHYNHCSLETLQTLKGYSGIEIFNGVVDRLDGSAYALDKWDRIQNADTPVWGFANDDSHQPQDVELGWNVVLVNKRTVPEILAAFRAGRFYASTGVKITSIEVKGSVVKVKTANAQRLAVYAGKGRQLARVDGSSITFDAEELSAPFIRIECYGMGGRTAWTQPFFLQGGQAADRKRLLATRPVLNVARVKAAPQPGASDSGSAAVWKKALSHGGFLSLKTARTAKVQTHVQASTDGKTLVFRVGCDEPAMAGLKRNVKKNGDPSMWTDDGVEFFFDVTGSGQKYWHVMANSLGCWWAGYTGSASRLKTVRTAVRETKAGWQLEIAFSVAELASAGGGKGGEMNRWRLNIGRNRSGAGEVSTWKWVGDGFHNPQEFGDLRGRAAR